MNKFKYDLLKCKNSFIIIHDGLLTDSAETAKQHSELGIFQLNCRNSFRTLRVGQAFLFVNMKTYLRSHPSRLKDVMVILSLRSVVARKTMLCNTRLLPEKYKDIRYIQIELTLSGVVLMLTRPSVDSSVMTCSSKSHQPELFQ